jgi:hypothetical protein
VKPAELLAEARERGLAISKEPPDQLRVRGPAGALTPEFRRRLLAAKSEVFALLASYEARQERAARAWSAAYQRLSTKTKEWPTGGLDLLQRLRPGLLRDIVAAEGEGERATVAYRNGVEAEPWFKAALERWELLMLQAVEYLCRACCDCGRECTILLVDSIDGSRFCRSCAGGRRGP